MSFSPNKNFNLQVTGTNSGTWGVITNSNLSIADNALGGTLALNVAGSSNVNLTASQSSYLIHIPSGLLTGNINYNFPATGGFYFITNNTTGAFTLTATVTGGASGIVIPQGTTVPIYIDASIPSVAGAQGTATLYTGVAVTGTANALVVSQTIPANFSLTFGADITFFPTLDNTAAATMNVSGTGAKAIKKSSVTGLVDLDPGDFIAGLPIVCIYNGTVWISLSTIYEGTPKKVSTDQSLDFTALFNSYIASAALNLTISRTSTTLAPYWWIEGNALGGAITIIPDSNDSINVNGTTLSAGTHYVVPLGATFKLSTDAAGNLYILFLATGVTSVNVSGGTTGLTFTGGPITSSGTITASGTLGVPNGGTGLATLTANNVILGNGASTPNFVAPGTSGNILTSNGTTWASAAAPLTGAWLLLSVKNCAGLGTIAFTSLMSSAYDEYWLVYDNLYCTSSTQSVSWFASINNGSSYLTSSGNYAQASFGSTSTNKSAIDALNNGTLNTNSGLTASGSIKMYNANGSGRKRVVIESFSQAASGTGNISSDLQWGSVETTSAINAMEAVISGSTFAGGTMKLYGIKNS